MGRDPEVQNRQWREIRRAVLVRDHYTCYMCGAKANSVDHLVSRKLGGTHHMSNLVACCSKCNSLKGEGPVTVPLNSRQW